MLLRRTLYLLNYFVVRWQLVLAVLVVWLGSWWLKAHYGEEDSNLWIVMVLFIRIVQWTLVGLASVSIVTALVPWTIFLLARRARRITIQVQIGDGRNAEAGWAPLKISVSGPVIRPLLGTIRARLVFFGKKMSDAVILDTDHFKRRGIFRDGIRGSGQALLHDRGIYDVEKVHIAFYDMLNLIALPATLPYLQQLYTLPKEQTGQTAKAQPNTTEEQTHRIDIPKRVEGEYINYKEFETGDNIRRIVWQIYAKSGELVVRIPETRDPYASHLYFYVSFYEGFDLNGGLFDTELLNVYKDKVRNLFEALKKNGFLIRLPQDQEVPKLAGMSDKKNELFQISAAQWQKNNNPAAYVDHTKAAFVCLSALTPVQEVELLLRKLPESVPVVVIKMSDAIPSPFSWRPQDLFFKPEKQPYDHLRQPWMIAPLRRRLQENEEQIQSALRQRGNGWLTSAIEIEE